MEEILVTTTQESKKDLYTALAKAQAEMPIILKNKKGQFTYADLPEIISVVIPIITRHGISAEQDGIRHEDGSLSIKTVISHSSGQRSDPSIWPVPNPTPEDLIGKDGKRTRTYIQALMSNVTYIKRYSLVSKLCVGISDEDYDGNMDYEPKTIQTYTLSRDQQELLQSYLKDHSDIAATILNSFKVNYISQLPADKFNAITKRTLELIKAKELR